MCLVASTMQTLKFIKENKGKDLIQVYKILKYEDYSATLKAPYRDTVYGPGLVELVEKKPRHRGRARFNVKEGFHCYLTRKAALSNQGYIGDKVIAKFYVRPRDIIGVASRGEHAAFSKAILFKDEYNRCKNIGRRRTLKSKG